MQAPSSLPATANAARLTPAERLAIEGSTVLRLQGHLFDSGLINAALDVVETADGRFDLLEVSVRPNESAGKESMSTLRHSSAALLQLTLDGGRASLERVIADLKTLAARMPAAEAEIVELPEHCGGVFDRTARPASASPAASPAASPTTAASATSSSAAMADGGRQLLVIGAGLCAGPAVEYLSRSAADRVVVASAVDGEAQALCAAIGRANCTPLTVDASPANAEGWATLVDLLRSSDAALSLLPASMHVPVAEECLALRTPLVTASYVSAEMEALHERAVRAGVPLLCEMGLDPGLDHMSAVELIERAHADGGRVASFSSLCGGLPAPEAASTTPLGYKFSWSPAGVLAATKNSARYLADGVEVDVPSDRLLQSAAPLTSGRLSRALRLEVLPNRDSIPYAQFYGIDGEAASVFRGTLRYEGWSELFAQFAAMGLTSPTPLPPSVKTWPQLLEHLRVPDGTAQGGVEARAIDALRSLRPTGSLRQPGAGSDSPVLVSEAFCELLASRLPYAPGERDAVYMEHTMRVDFPAASGRPSQLISSSLVG